MSNIKDIKKRAKAAGQRTNQNETKSGGGGEFTPPAEGKTTMRLLEYIELGVQKGGMYKGKPKKATAKVQVAFELLGKKHLREVETDKGKTEIRGTYFRIFPNLSLSLHEKAGFKKLYNLLAKSYGNSEEITHMSQLLGEAFAGTIRNNVSGDKTYSNLTDESNNFVIGAPVREELDEDGEVISVKKLSVPELTMQAKLFLWDEPTKEDWEALDEKTQERIRSAENFKGSPIELLLEGGDKIKTHVDEEDEDLDEDDEDSKPVPKKTVKKAAKVVEEEEDDEADEDDVAEEELDEEDEEEVAPKKATKKSSPAVAKTVGKPKATTKVAAKTAKSPSKAKSKKVADELDELIDDED